MVIRLLFIVLSGFGLHQAYKPTLTLGQRWGGMLREAIGVLGILPGLLLLHDQEGQDSLIANYILTCFAFGSGVFAGHLVDRISHDD